MCADVSKLDELDALNTICSSTEAKGVSGGGWEANEYNEAENPKN